MIKELQFFKPQSLPFGHFGLIRLRITAEEGGESHFFRVIFSSLALFQGAVEGARLKTDTGRQDFPEQLTLT